MPPPQWMPSGAAAVSGRPASRPEPAPLMRDALRRGSMLRLPDEDPADHRAQRAAPGRSAVTPAHSDDADGPAPFVLPGPPPARETLAGLAAVAGHPGLVPPGPAAGPGRLAGTAAAAADAL